MLALYYNTNVTEINESLANDRQHRLKCDGTTVFLKELGEEEHSGILNISIGKILVNAEGIGSTPSVSNLAGGHDFQDGRYIPHSLPARLEYDQRGGYSSLPLLFELERIARKPVILYGVYDMCIVDGYLKSCYIDRSFHASVSEFIQAYATAGERSVLKMPVVEGFYRAMKRKNAFLEEKARDSRRPFEGRMQFDRLQYRDDDFSAVFGNELYCRLRSNE